MRRLVLLLGSLAILPAGPAFAQWKEYETAHFKIISESPPANVEKFAEELESYDKLMRMATATSDDEKVVKVRIFEVPSTTEVENALGLSGTGIAGFYTNNQLGPYAVTPRKVHDGGRYFDADLVLHHEYAHHFMLQYFPTIYPSWYIEGFAEMIGSSLIMSDGRIGYGMPAKQRGNEIVANWVPLNELLTKSDVKDVDPYAQGWALTHFFTFDKTRSGQLRQYLSAISAGKSFAEAAKVFGDLTALNREARRYVTSGSFEYKPVTVAIAKPAVTRERILSAGEVDLMPETMALDNYDISSLRKEGERKRAEDRRAKILQKIRDGAAKYPTDGYAQMLLAEAEFDAGNYAQARAATDRLLAVEPNNVRGLARLSMLKSLDAAKLQGPARTAAIADARASAIRANRLAPLEALPLLAYYQSYSLTGEAAPTEALNALYQVVSTVPGDDKYRLLLVDELDRRHSYDEAIMWLTPLSNSPHDSPQRAAAQERQKQLIAKRDAARAAKSAS